MRASIILALVGLVSNMTEAIQVTAAVNSDDDDDVQVWENGDCSGNTDNVGGPFSHCRFRFCKKPFVGATIPAGATLELKLKDTETNDLLPIAQIIGDGSCVNVIDYLETNEGYSAGSFEIYGGNVRWE